MKAILQLLTRLRSLPIPKKMMVGLPVVLGILLVLVLLHRTILNRNWTYTLILGAIILVFLALFLIVRFLQGRRDKKEGEEFHGDVSASIRGGGGPADQQEYEREFQQLLRDYIARLRKRGRSLYTIPWYMVIGESSSGKSMMISKSSLHFDDRTQRVKGTGGTLYVDWWLAMEGVVLDTAGRLSITQVEVQDKEQWDRFIAVLKRNRPHCPVNGVVVTVPVTSLLEDDAAEQERKADLIRVRLNDLQEGLGVQFPIWLVVTKSDLLVGFREFVDQLNLNQRYEMLGWSKEGDFSQPWSIDEFDAAFDTVLDRLRRWCLRMMSRTDLLDHEIATLNQFSKQFERIREPLRNYISKPLMQSTIRDPVFFRGFYFTSGIQQGDPIPAGSLSRVLSSGLLTADEVQDEGKAVFIRDFFRDKVFKEQGLIVRPTWAEESDRKARRLARVASICVAAIAVTVLGLSWLTYRKSGFPEMVRLAESLGPRAVERHLPEQQDLELEAKLREGIRRIEDWRKNWVSRFISGVGSASQIRGANNVYAGFIRERIVRPILQGNDYITRLAKLDRLSPPPDPKEFEAYLDCYRASYQGQRPPGAANFTQILKTRTAYADTDFGGKLSATMNSAIRHLEEHKDSSPAAWGVFPEKVPGAEDKSVDTATVFARVGGMLAAQIAEASGGAGLYWWPTLEKRARQAGDTLLREDPPPSVNDLDELGESLGKLREHVLTGPPGSEELSRHVRAFDSWIQSVTGAGDLGSSFARERDEMRRDMERGMVGVKQNLKENYAYLVQFTEAEVPVLTPTAQDFLGCLEELAKSQEQEYKWSGGAPDVSKPLSVDTDLEGSLASRPVILQASGQSPARWKSWDDPWSRWVTVVRKRQDATTLERNQDLATQYFQDKILTYLEAYDSGLETVGPRLATQYRQNALAALADFRNWLDRNLPGAHGLDIRGKIDERSAQIAYQYYSSMKTLMDDWESQVKQAWTKSPVDRQKLRIPDEMRDTPPSSFEKGMLPSQLKREWIPDYHQFQKASSNLIAPSHLVDDMGRLASNYECLATWAKKSIDEWEDYCGKTLETSDPCQDYLRYITGLGDTARPTTGIFARMLELAEQLKPKYPSKGAIPKEGWMDRERLVEAIDRCGDIRPDRLTLNQKDAVEAFRAKCKLWLALYDARRLTVSLQLSNGVKRYAYLRFDQGQGPYQRASAGGAVTGADWPPSDNTQKGAWQLILSSATSSTLAGDDFPITVVDSTDGQPGVWGLLQELIKRSRADPNEWNAGTWTIEAEEFSEGWRLHVKSLSDQKIIQTITLRAQANDEPTNPLELPSLDWEVWEELGQKKEG
jgi:hypothetical protein